MPKVFFLLPLLAAFSQSAMAAPESVFVELGKCAAKENSELDFQIFSDSLIKANQPTKGFLLLKSLPNPQYADEVIQVAMKVDLFLSESNQLRFKHPLLDARKNEFRLSSGAITEFTSHQGDLFVCKMNRM
jgi:hypothetical protein